MSEVISDLDVARTRAATRRVLAVHRNDWLLKYWEPSKTAMSLPRTRSTIILEGAEATAVLQEGQRAALETTATLANLLPGYAWLYFLRMADPQVLSDDTLKGIRARMERRRGVEDLSAFTQATELKAVPQRYPEYLVVKFAVCARNAVNVSSLLRTAAKGVPISFDEDRWPTPITTHERWAALQVHDERTLEAPALTSLVGTRMESNSASDENLMKSIVWPVSREEFQYRNPTAQRRNARGDVIPDWNFMLTTIPFNVPRALLKYRWHNRSLPSTLILHWAGMALAMKDYAYSGYQRLGLVSVPVERFLDMLDFAVRGPGPVGPMMNEVFPSCDVSEIGASELFALGLTLPDSSAVTPGPVIRPQPGGEVVFDPLASARRVLKLFQFDLGSGTASDARAHHLEEVAQELIDSSPWCPPVELRAIRGRHLVAKDGTRLTDIDAMAVRGRTILMIDAKSYAPAGHYDGKFAPTRNVRVGLEKAVQEWSVKIEYLRRNPIGRNYDFSDFPRILGLVITATPHFVNNDLLEQTVLDQLRPVSSLGELENFLAQPLTG